MIVKDKEKVSQPIDASLHYKMYKDGKHWVTAGITTLMFSGLILGTQTTAHADTATASTSGNGQAQATTGGNAVTQTTAQSASTSNANTAAASQTTANTVSATAAAASTATQSQSAGTITQPVAVDHSQLDQAVAAAKQAGLNPQQQPTTSSTVAPSEVESAKANIESDYASQAAKLQEATDQKQTINKYNGSKGDSSALDAAVKEAQNTPGLTVTQDQTKTTSLKANDKSGIANWESNTAADYSSQVDAINKAIAAQKQENAEYEQKLSEYNQQVNKLAQPQHFIGAEDWTNAWGGYFNFKFNYDVTYTYNKDTDQVTVLDVKFHIDRLEPTKHGGGFWDSVMFTAPGVWNSIPKSTQDFWWPNGDVPGIDGNQLWRNSGASVDNVFAFLAQNNKTGEYIIKYKQISHPYTVSRNSDGTFTLFTDINRDNNTIGYDSKGIPNHWRPGWGGESWKQNLSIPTPPTRKTSSINYHYNVVNITPGVPDKDNVSYQYHDLNVATTPEKNWTQGSQIVNGKTEINDDVVSATVKMTTPAASQVEGGMKTLAVTDNYSKFANNVTYQGAQVYENDQLVTSLYNVTNNAADATVTATRKDASTTPAGTVSLVVDFKINSDVPSGTKFENSGSGTINNSTVPTNDAEIVTYEQSAEKHWIEGTQTVDGKTYINDDVVTTKVDMSLPDPSTLAHSLTNVTVDDDYSDFQDKVTPQSYRVEENGKDVTSEYNVTYGNGHLTAVRKTPSTAPAGKVSLIATWLINANVASGTKLTNRGSGRINNHTVPTNTPDIKTYTQTAEKHWVEGSQTVDDKTYVDGDEVHARIEMSLPDPSTLAKPLTDITLVDNYSDYADKVDYKSAQVLENGKDVTSQYTITNVGGKITAMRKTPGTAPAGTVQLLVNFKVKTGLASGTKLNNYGSGRINNHTVNTNNAKIVTYQQTTDKHWVDGTQIVDGKTYVDGDTINGQVSMSLPDPSTLAKKLTKVAVTDDYSNFKDKVDYQEAHVYENGVDVTSEYNIVNNAGTETVTATRKDASSAPKGTVVLTATWKVHDDVASGTSLVNSGSGTINDETIATPDRTVKTYKQDTNKTWNIGDQTVNDKLVINNDQVQSTISMTLPDQNTLAKKLTKVQLVDDYSGLSKYADVKTVEIRENGKDVSSQYDVQNDGSHITATRKNAAGAPAGNVQMLVTWQVRADVPSGTQLENKGTGTLDDESVPTPSPKVVTYTPETDKHWVNGSQVVDGKTFIDGDQVSGKVTMSLPDPAQLAQPLSKVAITDDFSNFADKVDYKSAKVLENGKDVTSEYSISVANGKVVATRKNAADAPKGTLELDVDWTVHTDVPSNTELVNTGSGTIDNDTVPTPKRTIVTYKQTADKHWVSGGQNVDGKVAINDDNVTAQVNMTLPDKSKLGGSINKVQLTDDFSKFAKDVTVQAVHVYENGIDVTSEYNIAIDPNGKVVATRKDPSKVNTAGNGSSTTVTMKANMKAADSLDASSLVAKASGNVNGQTSTTKTSMLLLAPTTDIAVENGQVKSQVNMSLPSDTSDVKSFAITDDYSDFSKYADASEVHVYENGTDATSKYAVTDNDGKVTATRKDMSDAEGGNVTMTVDYKLNHDIPNGTVLENHGSGTLNDETVPTNTPSITTYTQTADKHWVEGTQTVDGKVYIDGTLAHAQVTTSLPDPATLTDKLTDVSITDDYSAFADKVDFQSAQVLENGKDVTSEYTITKQGDKITATRKDPGSAPAGNAQLLLTFKIHSDVPSGTQLENVGSSTINNHTVSTNKATITTFKPDPKKDVVVSVDNNKSLNGANIDLNSSFDYKLEGSTVPKNSTGITEYGFHDDYDQEHDQYNGGYTVLLNSDVTLTDGTVLKKGTDVTKYTTQTIDQDNGIIDIEFDQDFLTKVDYAKSEFGATAYLKMMRVKAGDVENKYVNSINNQAFNSNTVKTHTDEPKPATPKNETPVTPQATTPETPLSPKTSQQPVFAAVQPAALQTASQSQAPSQGQQQLPQTGNDKDEALALTGLASLLFGLGTLGMKKRRRHA